MEQQSRSTAHKLQSCDDQPPPPASLDKQQQPLERTKTLSAAESEKVTQILQACRDNDIDELVTLATSRYGFVEDVVRRIAWPLLLGSSTNKPNDTAEKQVSWRDLPPHKEEEQVKLDVNRSFVYYPRDESSKQLDSRKQELSDLITEVLRRQPALCYFQGYHDIVQVFLLVLGLDHAAPAVSRLSVLRIRDFMLPTMTAAMSHLQLLQAILHTADAKLWRLIESTPTYFALSATLTLYAHDIEEYGDIARLFDFLLAREAVISIYLFAAIILSRRDELFEIPSDEPEMLHFTLSKLPKPLDFEPLISQAMTLFSQHPPESLPRGAWRKVSRNSVLKTTRDAKSLRIQTLEQGLACFERQELEIRTAKAREETMKVVKQWARTYARPAGAVGLTVAVGVLAWWLSRPGAPGGPTPLIEGLTEYIRRFTAVLTPR